MADALAAAPFDERSPFMGWELRAPGRCIDVVRVTVSLLLHTTRSPITCTDTRRGFFLNTLLLRALVCALLGLLANASAAPRALAAAPPIILVSGPPLCRPIVLAEWGQIISLLSSGADDPPRGQLEPPGGRTYFDLALFWEDEWWTYVQTEQPLDWLQPDQAMQHGRFYPASADEPALLVLPEVQRRGGVTLTSWSVRRMDEAGLAILAEHGVPVRMDTTNQEPLPEPCEPRRIAFVGQLALLGDFHA